jgi:hypothetical protein
MSGLDSLVKLAGKWQGVNKLWMYPVETPYESASVVSLTQVIKGKFVQLDYTWAFEGEPQEGILLFGYAAEEAEVTAVWADSFHTAEKFMIFRGATETDESIGVRGSYSVPGQPEWGWRIVVGPDEGGGLRIVMYNVTPDGEEVLAVEANYSRI